MVPFPKVRRPDPDTQRPLVVSSPHSGREIPDDEHNLYALPVTELEHDGDLFVDRLYAGAQKLGATFVSTPYNRFVIDLNRLPDDVSARSVEGGRAKRGPGYYGDRGLIWAVNTHGRPIYNRPLTRAEFERRRTRYYDPYHAFLREELERLREQFGYVVLLDAHSMPSRAARMHPDPGHKRPDVVPGDLLGGSCAPWLTHMTSRFWRGRGYTVTPNTPYRGGGIIRAHGRPDRGIHAIQLELNRALYMDEDTMEPHDGLDRLRIDCLAFVAALAEAEPDPMTADDSVV